MSLRLETHRGCGSSGLLTQVAPDAHPVPPARIEANNSVQAEGTNIPACISVQTRGTNRLFLKARMHIPASISVQA